jgi:putative spermidine/putrescine transport system substrate-binding protein
LLTDRPHALPLNAAAMVAAFKKWDTDVGAQKTK